MSLPKTYAFRCRFCEPRFCEQGNICLLVVSVRCLRVWNRQKSIKTTWPSVTVRSAFHALHDISIRGISSHKNFIQLPLYYKTTVQTFCGLADYIGNSTESSFSPWRLLDSCVSYKCSILHSYFHHCLA